MDIDAENIKTQISKLKAEYEETLKALSRKKEELNGLASGTKKYKNNPQMLEQLKQLVLHKHKEINEILLKFQDISKQAAKIGLAQDILDEESSKKRISAKVLPQVSEIVIAESEACEKILKHVIKEVKPVVEKADKKEALAIEKPEEKTAKNIAAEPPKKASKKSLNELAKSEAEAQEKFLRSKSTNYFGQA